MADGRAVGVDCVGPRGGLDLTADRIVLCAGAIASAQLLMLSGIGPQDVLRAAGMSVEADLPVGVGTADHPGVGAAGALAAHRGRPAAGGRADHSGRAGDQAVHSGFGAMTSGRADDPTDQPHLGVTLMRPRSRGRVAIASGDPEVAPGHRAPLRQRAHRRRIAARRNAACARTGRRHSAIRAVMVHLAAPVRHRADGAGQRSWTAGAASTASTGLWVVDGSILPAIPSRGPHATIVMAAHRAAEFVSDGVSAARASARSVAATTPSITGTPSHG